MARLSRRLVTLLGAVALSSAAGCGSARDQPIAQPRVAKPERTATQVVEQTAASSTPVPESAPAASTAPPAAAIEIIPVRIVATMDKLPLAFELDPTGIVTMGVADKSRPIGRIEGATLVSLEGKTLVTLAADGTLTVPDEVMQLDAKNEVVVSSGTRVRIANDGTIHFTAKDGTPKDKVSARVERFSPEKRRTAMFVLMSIFHVQ